MKDVFQVHARRIHLMSGGKCPLTMKLANLKQGIEILELFQHILPRVNPVDDRLSTDLQNKLGKEDISWSFRTRPAASVECQLLVRSVQEHNDMYFVRIIDIDGHHEQAFFKHLDIHDVMAQLKKLIGRWKKELEKAESNSQLTSQMVGRIKPHLSTVYPNGEALKQVLENVVAVEHHLMLDKMGSQATSEQSQPGCEPKQRDIFNTKKESE